MHVRSSQIESSQVMGWHLFGGLARDDCMELEEERLGEGQAAAEQPRGREQVDEIERLLRVGEGGDEAWEETAARRGAP
jgi:hypothetical protein